MEEKNKTKRTISGNINVPYRWPIDEIAQKFFKEIKEHKKLFGLKCSKCQGVIIPPQNVCGKCFARTDEWVELPDAGRAYGIVPYLLEFPGQYKKPPIIFARIVLEGASTPIIHILDEVDEAKLIDGMKVKAVWREEREGNIEDIKYFKSL